MSKALKWIIGIIVALAVVAGGGYVYLRFFSGAAVNSASALSQYSITRLTKGEIDQTVSASGVVRTNQSSTVTWQASGIVGKVNAKVGDKVKANDILASLDPANLPNNIIQAQTSLSTDTKALTDLQNNKSNLPTLQKAVITAQKAVDDATTARNNLNGARGSADQVSAAEAGVVLAQQKVNQAQSNYNGTPGDPSTDARKAQALGALEAAKTAYDKAVSNLNYINGHATATDIATADNALALAKAQLADAQRALDQTNNGIDPSVLTADQARIDADNAIIDQQNLRAPFDGTITNAILLPGDTVLQGTVAFRIDDLSSYFIDMAVSEVDIAKVAVGQAVNLAFDAIPNPATPYTGVVTYVSQVGTTSSAVVNFTVTVQITNPDDLIKPGITSAGNIVVNSVKDVYVVPTKAIKTVSGKKVVYAIQFVGANGQPVPQTFGRGTGGTGTGTGALPGAGTGANGGTKVQAAGTPVVPTVRAANGTPVAPAAVTEKLFLIQVQEGLSNGTETEVSGSALTAGTLIVTNPPANGVPATTGGGGGVFGGLFGGRRFGG